MIRIDIYIIYVDSWFNLNDANENKQQNQTEIENGFFTTNICKWY